MASMPNSSPLGEGFTTATCEVEIFWSWAFASFFSKLKNLFEFCLWFTRIPPWSHLVSLNLTLESTSFVFTGKSARNPTTGEYCVCCFCTHAFECIEGIVLSLLVHALMLAGRGIWEFWVTVGNLWLFQMRPPFSVKIAISGLSVEPFVHMHRKVVKEWAILGVHAYFVDWGPSSGPVKGGPISRANNSTTQLEQPMPGE